MKPIRILTDSASDLCAGNAEQITVLPMTIRFGEAEYQDGVTITHRAFYEKLLESDTLPTTSLVSPAAFGEAFQAAVDAGETVIAITVSSALSGTYQSAALAALDFPGRVFVVDSRNAAVGEQILARYAAQLARTLDDPAAIVEILERDKHKIHTIAMLDTLEYLKKGGRCSSTTAFVGGVLSIKPVLAIQNGEIAMLGKARGSKNGNNFLIREIEQTAGIDFEKPLCLGYTGLSDANLQKYIADSSALYAGHEDCLRTCCVGATIGTHIGPGAIAVSFFEQ